MNVFGFDIILPSLCFRFHPSYVLQGLKSLKALKNHCVAKNGSSFGWGGGGALDPTDTDILRTVDPEYEILGVVYLLQDFHL